MDGIDGSPRSHRPAAEGRRYQGLGKMPSAEQPGHLDVAQGGGAQTCLALAIRPTLAPR